MSTKTETETETETEKEPDAWVCVDCILAIANGEMPEDPKRAREVHAGLKANPGIVRGSGEKEFSWDWCDCCNSPLGGSRYGCGIIEG